MSDRLVVGLCLLAALAPALGLGAELPSARAGWQFGFRDFAIGAWNPPAATEAEYRVYREAGFNLVMSPRYALPDQALELARRHGLHLLVDTYAPNDRPWGGTAGPHTPHPSHHPATLPELQWLHARYGGHPALAGYLLGDDYGALPAELVETTRFLRTNAPRLLPWVCQNVMSAESLARAGNPLQDPQIYPTLYQQDWPAGAQAVELCRQLQTLRQGCRRYGLIPWPMFNVCGVASDSLVRFQVYASLAFGAEGIMYFTYRDGLQQGQGYATEAEVRAHLLPTWAVAAAANHRVARWGPRLLGSQTAGLLATGRPLPGCVTPASGRLVEAMDDDLLVGVRLKAGAAPLAVVVDRRVDKAFGALPEREVTLRFAPAVTGLEALGADRPQRVPGRIARVKLAAGEGTLLALQGQGLERLAAALEPAPDAVAAGRKVGPEGLLLALDFEEGQGEVAHDVSGLHNDLWLQGAQWVAGRQGRGVTFAAAGASAYFTDACLPATEALSVAVWVRPVYPETGYAPIFLLGSGGTDRCEFGLGPDNLYPVLSNGQTHSGSALYVNGLKALLPPGQWGHLALCADARGATTYVNGVPVVRSSYAGSFNFLSKDLRLGVRGAERYHGDLDGLRVWNRRLSDDEVAALAKP